MNRCCRSFCCSRLTCDKVVLSGHGALILIKAAPRKIEDWLTLTGDIPVGAYDPKRLANLGIGHGAIDGGAGYTYFNPQTGHEFSGGWTCAKSTAERLRSSLRYWLD
jgi:hypothetical protein